ncbi:hypothetical protein N0V82_000142 [Gnomoniopsis sp. IMI 355080]|nr:hypothetical protein N0V82_000142 [Gnomoniopsis sp. IMI 355080]
MAIVTRSGHNYTGYATSLSYLLDIVGGLPKFYRDVLRNQEELDKDHRIPLSLQNAPPVRDLEMNTDVDFTSDKWISNMIGLFVFVSGDERTLPDQVCAKGAEAGNGNGSRRFGDRTVIPNNAYVNDLKVNYRK